MVNKSDANLQWIKRIRKKANIHTLTNDKCCVACAMWVRDINSSGGAASIIYIPLSQLSQNSFSHSTRSLAAFPQRSHKTAN